MRECWINVYAVDTPSGQVLGLPLMTEQIANIRPSRTFKILYRLHIRLK